MSNVLLDQVESKRGRDRVLVTEDHLDALPYFTASLQSRDKFVVGDDPPTRH